MKEDVKVGDIVFYFGSPDKPYRVRELAWSRGTYLIDPLGNDCTRKPHWAYVSTLEKARTNPVAWDSEAI